MKLLFEEETGKILGAAIEVHQPPGTWSTWKAFTKPAWPENFRSERSLLFNRKKCQLHIKI